MPEALFQQPFYAVWQNAIRSAIEDVSRLDRKAFSDPSLAGQLQRIVQKYSFEVARLKKEGVEAKARQRQRDIRDALGDRRTATQGLLEVTIPFSGSADSLRICPSRSTILSHAVEIGRQALVLTVADDDRANNEVESFITQANQNLDVVRSEYESMRPQLEQAVQNAATQRQAQIAGEVERDKKLSFPVRR